MKEEVFEKIKRELYILDDKVINEELNILSNKYEKSDGKLDIDYKNTIKEIYSKHGIDVNKLNSKRGFFYNEFKNIYLGLEEFLSTFTGNDFKTNFFNVLDILIIVFIVILLKIPFEFVNSLLTPVITEINLDIANALVIILNILYAIVAIISFMILIKRSGKKASKRKKIKEMKAIMPTHVELESFTLKDEKK